MKNTMVVTIKSYTLFHPVIKTDVIFIGQTKVINSLNIKYTQLSMGIHSVL